MIRRSTTCYVPVDRGSPHPLDARAILPAMLSLPRTNPVERRMSRFLREPPSVRIAASVIVAATLLITVGGGLLMRILDSEEYPNIWVGMWWALQTVTTIGYGDVSPKEPSGRIVAAFVMLEGVALLTITIAVITSTFVTRAARERDDAEAAGHEHAEVRIEAKLDDLAVRLERLESMLNDVPGIADAVAQDADEPEECDPREGHEAESEQHGSSPRTVREPLANRTSPSELEAASGQSGTTRRRRASSQRRNSPISGAVSGTVHHGGGGNRTRVRGRTEQSVYERSPCLISPAGRFTDDPPTGQPSFRRHASGDGTPFAPSPIVGAELRVSGPTRVDVA